ncbi:hypothetical protein KBD33_01220 [Candidatus Gracilibacteria bacterium]|nr:hypothetical protein [Candidatus Gracilibacteria bacterium]
MKIQYIIPLSVITSFLFLASCAQEQDDGTHRRDRTFEGRKGFSGGIEERRRGFSGGMEERRRGSSGGMMNQNQSTTIDSQSEVKVVSGVTESGQRSYDVPEGHRVTTEYSVTVDGDIITGVSMRMVSGDHESREYHDRMNRRLATTVVGKKISELNLNVIGGASLTTQAFKQFLTESF